MKKLIFYLNISIYTFFTTGCSSDDESPVKDKDKQTITAIKSGGVIDVELGGPNEPNSVYIDLSTSKTTTVRRDTWELGFYNGKENRVFLNSSILVTAARTEFTDLDKVTRTSTFKVPVKVKYLVNPGKGIMGYKEISSVEELLEGLKMNYSMYAPSDESVHPFTDNKKGTLDETALGEIATNPSLAKVYIVSAGSKIPTTTPSQGSISTTMKESKGGDRGFYKIKVFIKGKNYVIQYAKLDDSTHKEAAITKEESHNLNHFSLLTGKVLEVEPPKTDFDINFAGVFSFYSLDRSHIDSKEYYAGVTYSDYVLTNNLAGVGVYTVLTQKKAHPDDPKDATLIPTDAPSFDNFKKANIEENKFIYNDRSVIDSHWRNPFKGLVNKDRYYIVKDTEGNLYKLLFTAFMDEKGERGHCQFKYELLQ